MKKTPASFGITSASLTFALTCSVCGMFGSTVSATAATLEGDMPLLIPDPAPLVALENYARAGWQATLSTRAHGVRGTVTIVDADTFRVDNFFYDGGGINVHFILAAVDDNTVFRNARLVTDLNLLGTPHSGDSITIDLPSGTTFDGYNAISLWCIPAGANFGSGSFVNPVPEPTGTMLMAFGGIAFGLFGRLRRAGMAALC